MFPIHIRFITKNVRAHFIVCLSEVKFSALQNALIEAMCGLLLFLVFYKFHGLYALVTVQCFCGRGTKFSNNQKLMIVSVLFVHQVFDRQ